MTLPSFRTDTREVQVVLRLLTQPSVLAGFGATGGHQSFTALSCNVQTHKYTFNQFKLWLTFIRHGVTPRRSRELGGIPTQVDRIICESVLSEDFSQALSVSEACGDISLSASTTHGS